jgi:hypothetical protein
MSKRDISAKEIEELENTPLEHMLEEAEEVKTAIPRGGVKAVMSLRLDPETLRELEIYSREIGDKPTAVARAFIREGLHKAGKQLSSEQLLDMAKLRMKEEKKDILIKYGSSP